MTKIFHVALREFFATIQSKGFVVAVFLPMIISIAAIAIIPLVISKDGPAIHGHIAVIDGSPSGAVGKAVADRFDPAVLEAERLKALKAVQDMADAQAKKMGVPLDAKTQAMVTAATESAIPASPSITVQTLPADTNPETLKPELLKLLGPETPDPLLALVVVPPSAVAAKPTPAPGTSRFDGFEVLTAPKLDPQIVDRIEAATKRAIISERLARSNLAGDADLVRDIMSAPTANIKAFTKEGAKDSSDGLAILMPMAFMFLLWISVFSAGQYLLTSTIEEKGTRVMEVLLSAASPMEIMIGKIAGQMGVGLLILLVYAGLGVGSLAWFNRLFMLDTTNLAYMLIFFLIAFCLVACTMAAVGAAVSDMREAQALMTPIMLVLILPMVMWMPISRNPNGLFATVLSMTPPVSPFVMVLRIPAAQGSVPVPFWQIAVSIGLGLTAVVILAWAAAKIFRVGVLMYGKPPNFLTLLKWIRMA